MNADQNLSSDRITALPQTIIETILCLLPTEEAARTSKLSREWRYKWTTIPKLVFASYPMFKRSNVDLDDMASERQNMSRIGTIHQILLLRQGPIHEFSLSAYAYDADFEIDEIILHLSRNHPIKKLTLSMHCHIVPLCLFSMHHLTDLCLEDCYIKDIPVFNGFSNLTSLSMSDVAITKECFLHLLSNCPSLKRLSLLATDELDVDDEPTITELFKCLPAIEHLTTDRCYVQYGVEVSVPKELPVSLPHLKYFYFDEMGFDHHNGLPFLCGLIKYSPNMEKIELKIGIDRYDELHLSDEEQCSNVLNECSDCWLEHLNELKIEVVSYFKFTMELVKFMLARSPNLKKVILDIWEEDNNEELEMLKLSLRPPKASPVEFIIKEKKRHWL